MARSRRQVKRSIIKAGFVEGVFLPGQQVHEQRADAGALENLSDKTISCAMAAAAAAMGEQDNSAGLGRNDQRSLELDSVDRNLDDPAAFFRPKLIYFSNHDALRISIQCFSGQPSALALPTTVISFFLTFSLQRSKFAAGLLHSSIWDS